MLNYKMSLVVPDILMIFVCFCVDQLEISETVVQPTIVLKPGKGYRTYLCRSMEVELPALTNQRTDRKGNREVRLPTNHPTVD